MILTFRINTIIKDIIHRLSEPITTKGTKGEEFKNYQPIFNSLSEANKIYIIRNILYSRGRLIEHGIKNKQNIRLEGLGEFKYFKHRDLFYAKLREKVINNGYQYLRDVPVELKNKLITEANKELDEYRINDYYKNLKVNSKPKVISLPLNLNRQIKESK